ncbi:hypothetical protein ACQCT6_17835 [Cytobacillus gottheilii]|uniref:Uncharacterized protein n=1 Tax=Cytobacillus gottheilii TaxID=859144 RepID=A0ABX8F7M0_9BACI|nr:MULTISPECIES: hypothetical protein [Bacillaceae]QVY60120.1 hypothetical protein J1899_13880 [Cytobacillus gottheilii]
MKDSRIDFNKIAHALNASMGKMIEENGQSYAGLDKLKHAQLELQQAMTFSFSKKSS